MDHFSLSSHGFYIVIPRLDRGIQLFVIPAWHCCVMRMSFPRRRESRKKTVNTANF
ncbi:MAG: hypothetical protein ACRYE8_01785 [Janthinobacterium lividum]